MSSNYISPSNSPSAAKTIDAVGDALGGFAKIAGIFTGAATGLGGLGGVLDVAGGTNVDALKQENDENFARQLQLIDLQQQIQSQGFSLNAISNVSKTEHENRRAVVQNIRAG